MTNIDPARVSDRDAVGETSRFASGSPDIEDVPFTFDALHQLAHQPDGAERLVALLPMVDPEILLAAIPALSNSPSYERIFPELRRLAGHGLERHFQPRMIWGEGWHWGSVGEHTYGQPRIGPYPGATLTIGRYCSIAEDVTFILGNHRIDCASSYPFRSGAGWPSQRASGRWDETVRMNIEVGNDVWLGYGVTVLAGTRIGNGAVIAAKAVARGNIPPYSIYGGNPIRHIRNRFEDSVIARLQSIAWWDWPDWRVDQMSDLLLDPDIHRFLDEAEALP